MKFKLNMDSDSDLSTLDAIPPDAKLEKGLRDAVAKIFKTDNREDLTVKRMRVATEKALGLPETFFKGHARWKAESERIIRDEAEKQDAALGNTQASAQKHEHRNEEEASAVKRTKLNANPSKRASPDQTSQSVKRQKTTAVSDKPSDDELSTPRSDLSEEESKKPVKAGKVHSKGIAKAKKEGQIDSDEGTDPPAKKRKEANATDLEEDHEDADHGGSIHDVGINNVASKPTDSGTESSEVLDPSPPPKRKRKSRSTESSAKPNKKSRKVSKVEDNSNLSSDEAEIKRLQGWLLKCGIRKMWFRELAPYKTPKDKIGHLREMLKDAGMEGRYSLEKARQIKEERELKADLDLVQEGAKRWGADSEEKVDEKGRPKRRLARGFKDLEFLGSDDGEETD